MRLVPMQQKSEIQQGWEFSARIMGADLPAYMGIEYVNAVKETINNLEESINSHRYRNLDIDQLQGFLFEEWGAGTFNIDAVAAGSNYRADTLHSTAKNSVDIQVKNSEQSIDSYSVKSYKNGVKSVVEQARVNPETGKASYQEQGRLIPSDQISEAKAEACRRVSKNRLSRPKIAEIYSETEQKLTDRIATDDGVQSRTVTRKELEQIAKESKSQGFRAKEHGVTVESAIRTEYILKQALKAGCTAATITVAIQLAPEIFKALDYLIKHGEISVSQMKKSGINGVSAGAEGFLRGAVASSLMIMCAEGSLGESFTKINPTAMGIIVAIVMQTVKNSILVAAGKMSSQQMGEAFLDTIIISEGYLIGAHIGGTISQALGFSFPVVGYSLGSLIGTSLCVVYNIGKKKLISFCIDTGFTCFGLVEQNYELPESVLHEIGVETIQIPRTRVEREEVSRTHINGAEAEMVEYETIDITILR